MAKRYNTEKMIKSYIPYLLAFITLIAGNVTNTLAQRDTTKLNQEVEVIKAYRPSISNANKINVMPEIDDTTRFTPEFNYQINSRPVTSGFTSSPISAAKLEGAAKENPGYGLIKIGVGTYSTPYGEIFFNNPKSKSSTFGVHLKHISSQGTAELPGGDVVDAPYSHTLAEMFGSYIFTGATLSARISYNRDGGKYYGYPDTIPANINEVNYAPFFNQKQHFQKGAMFIGLKSNDGKDNTLQYNTGLHFHHFSALTNQKEKNGGIFADFNYKFNNFRGILETSYDHFSTDSISENSFIPTQLTSKQRSWLKLSPSLLFEGENWKAQGGINFYSVFEKDGESVAKMYPKIDLSFTPVENIMTVYAGLDGYMQNNNYSTIVNENFWIDPRNDVKYTDFKYIVSGGLKGKISTQVAYNFGAKYSEANGQYFYTMNVYDPDLITMNADLTGLYFNNALAVDYDNVGILDLSGELSYSKGDQFFFLLSGHFYNYSLESLEAASHLPDYTVTATSKYRLTGKITAFTDVHFIGERKVVLNYQYPPESSIAAPAPFITTLDPVININLGADYQLMKKIKLYGRIDNLLNQHYEKWLGYSAQGLRFMLGASYSF